MSFQAEITLDVPDLPDASIWFANAAAWKNYWRFQLAILTVTGANTSLYTPVPYVASDPCVQIIDGVEYVLVTQTMFDSLMLRLDAMEASYQDLRTQLKDAGIINTAQ